jgi:glycosyltransferase involved in cell wall biosynthesis
LLEAAAVLGHVAIGTGRGRLGLYEGHRIAVVVPAHNEERLIATVVKTAPDLVDFVIVVDDASGDATADAARGAADPRLEVHTLPQNLGVGGAIKFGHRRALELGADISVVMAGDAQMDPAYLPSLLDPIVAGEAGFTKANRFYDAGSFAGMPRHRVFGNIALSFATKAASGYWGLFDPQNGYTAIHRSALQRLPLARIADRYDFENDLLINLNILRVPARDVPVPAVYGEEVSGMRPTRVAPRLLRTLVRGFWHRIWWKYVLQSFSAVALLLFAGIASVALGLAVSVFVVVNTLGEPVASAGTVLLAVAPLLTGMHLLVNALMLDIQEGNR